MIEASAAAPPVSQPQATMGPLAPSKRIEAIDILRGLAVLGIFLVNMLSFSGFRQPFEQMVMVDKGAAVLIRILAQAKFYPLFSLLFGWGMVIQMDRASQRGITFVPFYGRRLAVLLLIGLVHAILIWHGDILVTYALLGLPLLLFRKASDRVLLLAIAFCLLVPILISMPGPGEAFREAYGEMTAGAREAMIAGKMDNPFLAGSYGDAVLQRLRQTRFTFASSLYWITHVFAMMLVGVLLGRRQVLRNFQQYKSLFRWLAWGGLGLGLLLNAAWVYVWAKPDAVPGEFYDLATRGVRTLAGPTLTMGYLAGVILLAQQAAWHEQLGGLAAVGRLALTNYLLQSVISTLLFYGYGLSMYGEMGPFLTLLLTLVIFRGQIWFSNWWLARYRFGPVEWLWRTLTYGRRQPLRAG
jgi:uncharacterized protein